MTSNKIKMLLVGSCATIVEAKMLQQKLEALQTSKAGPFDVCFCVGTFPKLVVDAEAEAEADADANDTTTTTNIQFPLPVYVQDYEGGTITTTGTTAGTTTADSVVPVSSNHDKHGIIQLGTNLFYLQGDKATRDHGVQILEIKLPNQQYELVVGCCSKHVRIMVDEFDDKQSQPQRQRSQPQQCDILLSSDWPQGMEDVVNVDTEPLSYDVGQIALSCRPRYHIAPSSLQYHQSPPYSLPNSDHVGRFIGLAPVVTGKTTKSTKFIHALGLVPLAAKPPPTTSPSTLPCPFVSSASSSASAVNNNGRSLLLLSSSEPTHPHTTTKPVPGFVAAATARSGDGGYQRFLTTTKKRQRDNDDVDNHDDTVPSLEPPKDPNIKTLFLYGLHKDVTGQLQSTIDADNDKHKIFQAFASYGLIQVRYPTNSTTSTYCFLEFKDQPSALQCLLDYPRGRVTIDSVEMTLKWATPNNPTNNKNHHHHHGPKRSHIERHYVTEAEAPDSTTLYYHPPPERENDEDFANALCQHVQATLEETLNDGITNDTERVTAETEPALNVSVRRKDQQYGFLEFASHAAATMALAALTLRTDGGLIQDKSKTKIDQSKQEQQPPLPLPQQVLAGTTLRWARGEQPKTKREALLEALGLERQYFAADGRTDCWFCLASPTCETHLITGVYKEWYATMPKGPVHPGHVLLVPVTHTRQGAWTLSSSSNEWTMLLDKMAEHASRVYDCDLFVFERAMETKGGYHSHVNCVPIPRSSGGDNTALQLETTMLAHAKASGFDLRLIQSDLGIDALVKRGKGDSDSQYFYAEIRTQHQSHRFLHQKTPDDDNDNRSSVPLQFAREVLAAVLKNPKLAHWKSCVVDKDQEAQLATDFRESFTKIIGGINESEP